MTSFRLVLLSDTHVSRSHPFFRYNWEVALEAANALAPDVAVISGDVSFNGPDAPDDLAFAAAEMARLSAPVTRATPGNHDLGYSPAIPDARQHMTPARRAEWARHFGPDFWSLDHGGWRFVGLNPFLLDSGFAEAAEQSAMLDAALATDRPVGVFTHVPLFAHDPGETDDPTSATVRPGPRRALLDRFAQAGCVRFVASGHLHRDKRMRFEGIDFIWAPGVAFMSSGPRSDDWGGEPWCGFLDMRFDGDAYTATRVQPPALINHDLRNWSAVEGHLYFDIAAQPFRHPV